MLVKKNTKRPKVEGSPNYMINLFPQFISGLKDTLFDEYLLEDAAYLAVAGAFIFLAILCYTQSLFLTVVTLLAITFALGWAYAIYTFVLRIDFFPFMNILAAIIAIGVGADDTFILVKSWSLHKPDPHLR